MPAMIGTRTIFEYDYSNEVRTTANIYFQTRAYTYRTRTIKIGRFCSVSHYCAYFVVAAGSFNCFGSIRRFFQLTAFQ